MRSRSLFWTFAGVFLLVLVVATALQLVIGSAVLRPLATQNARQHAELAIERASLQLAALREAPRVAEVIRVLRDNTLEARPDILVFSMRDGPVVPDRRLPGMLHRRVVLLLAKKGLADATTAWSFPPPQRGDPQSGPPDRRTGPRPEGPPPGEAPGEGREFELLAHRSVTREGRLLGELAVVSPSDGRSPWSLPGSRSLLLFLPLAVLASGAAGLLMVRLLVRRLRALERMASRVIEGDLGARVEDRGLDEIGRLEGRFNQMTDRLAAARAQLEETDRQRRTLLADITHELATPLTSIRGYVETLLDPAVQTTPEERAGYLNDVLDESKRLDLMIGELFELARLEAHATPLELVRLDWNALCRNTARRLESRFREAGLALVPVGVTEPAWVRADGRRLEQVVENLLVNALRYVPAGGHVWLAMGRGSTPAGPRLSLTVSDDGPGIPTADLPHVFERFYRAETVRRTGGTGLGLAIVREIARQHGGAVRAEPREPQGAAFVVELPPAVD